jgi:hypothetical protein
LASASDIADARNSRKGTRSRIDGGSARDPGPADRRPGVFGGRTIIILLIVSTSIIRILIISDYA